MRHFSQSEQRLLDQMSSLENSLEDSEEPKEPGELRLAQVAWARRNLPRIHAESPREDLNAAFMEWEATCRRFLNDDLTELLEVTLEEGEKAVAAGQPFHFTGQFCFRLMQWGNHMLAFTEQDGAESDPPWKARVTAIYSSAERHIAALFQHIEAVAADQADSAPGGDDVFEDN
jgi:hypothetical protein